MRLLLSSSRARHGISGLLAVSYWAALLVLAAAAETAPRPAAQPEAPVESWGTTGQAPQTGSSAQTSGRAFRARIVVAIDKAAQEMKVFVDSVERYVWKV